MQLDPAVCERARQSRDARFDGRFFIGVVTTGVYCRPICPVKAPKAENVCFYASAAAAAEAGFRPCLRCRPERSAGTPDLSERTPTVHRALRLIGEGEAEEGGVDRLATLVGVTPRHLSRLFHKHLGASPISVIRTRRLHFAKRLIDETDLPMTTVAFSAGFGSLRRFNATFRDLYDRTPTELRGLGSAKHRSGKSGIFDLRLAYRPPFDWDSLLDFLRPRATPGVEEVTADEYRRTFRSGRLEGTVAIEGTLRATHQPEGRAIRVRVRCNDSQPLLEIVERTRRLFDLGAEMGAIIEQLGGDESVGPLISIRPGLRVPGAWDGFELAVRAILGQQVTVKGATTLAGRLARTFGDALQEEDGGLEVIFPSAEVLLDADLESIGLPRTRAHAIRSLARAVAGGKLNLDSSRPPEEVMAQLSSLPGIGDWTAQYVALRALGDPDAFPSSDLGLLKAASNGRTRVRPAELREIAEAWRPWRGYAALHLWQMNGATHKRPAQQGEIR